MASTVIPLRQSAVEKSLKQAAFDHLPLPAVCMNASAQVLAANVAATELLGLAAEAVVGRHLSELVAFRRHRESARRWAKLWARLQERSRLTLRAKLPLAEGRVLALELDAELLRFEQENVVAITLRDIEPQRRAEREERARRARLQALAQPATDLALLVGADRRVLAANAAAEAATGVAPADLLGVPFEYLLDEASSAEFLSAFEVARSGRSDEAGRGHLWRLRTRGDGRGGRWIEAALADRLRDPLVRAIVVSARDVTELRELAARAERIERRLVVFAENTADLLMVLDAGGVVRYQSPAIRAALGIEPESTLGQPGAALAIEEDRPALLKAIQAASIDVAGERTHACLVRANGANGAVHRLWVAIRNCSSEPALGGLLVTARDVGAALSQRAGEGPQQARRLEFRERLLELAIHTRADFAQSLARVLRTTAETLRADSVSFWRHARNPESLLCEAMFEGRHERFARDWIGVEFPATAFPEYFARLRDRQPLVVADARRSPLTAGLAGDRRWSGVRALLDAPVLLDGTVQGVLCVHHESPRHWDEDEVNFAATAALMVSLAMEAAQRQEAESRIEQLAWYDSLTGLPNRNLLRETMRDMIMTAANRRRRIAVMLIDLDRFKDVNDTLGHLVGDALIKSAAQVLKETVGDAGVVARLGGDEFVVLINEFEHRQEVALLAARMAQALHRTDLVPNVDTQVSASIGVALFPEHGREMSTLLKNADAAMYQAKRDGRNQFSFFNPIRAERAAREVQLGIQLLKAVQGDSPQFAVEYQPQVHMETGRVVGLEALIRWQHPAFGTLTPDRFIGVAEVSGLSERITRWVVNEVCAQIRRWREAHPGFDIPVAINVAGREMGSASLPILVRSALVKHDVEPRMITLEITERTLVKESEINNDVMSELASVGVGLVLDDFGTGYSMLGYLKRMPIQALKIDQSFVEGIPADADSCAIVHAMLAVARHFKLKVIAEGIETLEQVQYMRSIGCEYAQGYFYSRALPAQTILEYVERGAPEADKAPDIVP
ncbi:EAL domain-containing protein [Betaproteobacteria bacterium PRO7]|nr:EAL domain-containing protein [Betaproteobacteria bacterium PRO7]